MEKAEGLNITISDSSISKSDTMKKSEMRIIGMFAEDVAKRLNPNEAASSLGISYASAYNGLAELAKGKVLRRERVGNANVYGLEFGSEAAREALMGVAAERREEAYGKYGVGEIIRKTVERVREELPGLYAAVLFGSVAKGGVRKESDIDLLFILPTEERIKENGRLISDICSTKGLEGRAISSITVSVKEFRKMLEGEGNNVAKEAVHGGIPVSGAENFFGLVLGWLKWKGSPI